jgi:hypothetical protein
VIHARHELGWYFDICPWHYAIHIWPRVSEFGSGGERYFLTNAQGKPIDFRRYFK